MLQLSSPLLLLALLWPTGTAAQPQSLYLTSVQPNCIADGRAACQDSTPAATDTSAVTLGIRFTTSAPVDIVGVRFYRAQADMTPVSLWDAGCTLLATGAVSGPVVGWVDGAFSSPVLMLPGQTYIASYSAPQGGYAYQHNAFASDLTVQPVTAPSAGNSPFRSSAQSCPTEGPFLQSTYYVSPLWIVRTTTSTTSSTPTTTTTITSATTSTTSATTTSSMEGATTTTSSTEGATSKATSTTSVAIAPAASMPTDMAEALAVGAAETLGGGLELKVEAPVSLAQGTPEAPSSRQAAASALAALALAAFGASAWRSGRRATALPRAALGELASLAEGGAAE